MKTTVIQNNVTPINRAKAEIVMISTSSAKRILLEIRIGFFLLALVELALHAW